jgi:hypothetical protein
MGILLMATIVALTLIGTTFMYVGWNWGLVPTLLDTKMALHEIDFFTAFWLSMFFSTIGGFFKTSVTSNKS